MRKQGLSNGGRYGKFTHFDRAIQSVQATICRPNGSLRHCHDVPLRRQWTRSRKSLCTRSYDLAYQGETSRLPKEWHGTSAIGADDIPNEPDRAPEVLRSGRRIGVDRKVQYDANGKTLPASKKSLEADAKRKNISQSELLAQNMLAAKQTKPLGHVDAHHIVSARAKGALPSRTLLYGWGIGINDVDNGVFLPRNKKVLMIDPLLTKAIKHSVVHTAVYHLAVFNELRQAPPVDSNAGRARLNDIKQDLIDGTFPYRKDDLP